MSEAITSQRSRGETGGAAAWSCARGGMVFRKGTLLSLDAQQRVRQGSKGNYGPKNRMRFTWDERGCQDAATKSIAAPDCPIAGHASTRVTPCRNLAHKPPRSYYRQQMRNL